MDNMSNHNVCAAIDIYVLYIYITGKILNRIRMNVDFDR